MNDYIERIKPYRLTSHKAWEYDVEKRKSILKLDWNEATIQPSPLVKDRILNLLGEGLLNWYPDVKRNKILELLQDYVGVDKSNIQYFASSDSLHEYVVTMLLSSKKKALVLAPVYDNFRLACEVRGAEVFYSQFNEDFTFSAMNFESDIEKEKPQLVYICNPNNPTGYLHSVDYIEYLVKKYKDIFFIVDEAYYEFSGVTCSELVKKYDNIIITRTFSKAFAIANFRIGYMISSKTNIEMINKIRNPKNISSFSQEASIAALMDIDYMKRYVEQVRVAKRKFYEELLQIMPQDNIILLGEGNFLFISLQRKEEKLELISFLEKNFIFVRDLSFSYREGNFMRITIGIDSQMARVTQVIREFYEK